MKIKDEMLEVGLDNMASTLGQVGYVENVVDSLSTG